MPSFSDLFWNQSFFTLTEKIKASVKENGVIQGLLYLLLLNMTSHITKELGMAPGGEFRTAFHEVNDRTMTVCSAWIVVVLSFLM